jgi:hypothetical protein
MFSSGPVHWGKVKSVPAKVELSIVWIRIFIKAAVVAVLSGWRLVSTLIMNAELTAENRPALYRFRSKLKIDTKTYKK